MVFDLDQRTASLSIGEFSAFITGPRDSTGGGSGLWRAQLGTHWHNELRARAASDIPATEFEIPITGRVVHHGWTLSLTGRIDQLLRSVNADGRPSLTLREIKTVTRPLPADESELRAAYPDYFAQLAAYATLTRQQSGSQLLALSSELVFVETDSGLSQTVTLTPADDVFFRVQLERVVEFLNLRHRARERLRHLAYRSAFTHARPGQETTQADLTTTFERHPLVFFEAPTGFGKTGVLLEFALGQLRAGHFDRALYLTSKSTGQLQVVRTLAQMTMPAPETPNSELRSPNSDRRVPNSKPQTPNSKLRVPCPEPGTRDSEPETRNPEPVAPPATPVAVWHVRNKSEHCVNHTFHCVRDNCAYLTDAATRWSQSGLARFYLDEKHARDLDTLRAAGRHAKICPYEITRAALAFNDVWIGDYNYVFAPRNRGLFFEQPGFDAARTLLLIDEAHNLPSRVADAYSHAFTAADAFAVRDELHRTRPLASLVTAWDHWCHFLHQLRRSDALPAAVEDDARHLLGEIAKLVSSVPLDLAELGPHAADLLWRAPSLIDELASSTLPRLWWSPADGELALTCLDAASAIAATLRDFGGVVLASATLTPTDGFAAACGLDSPPPPKLSTLSPELQTPNPKLQTPNPELRTPNPKLRTPNSTVPDRLGSLNKRQTRKLYTQITSAAELLRVEEARDAALPTLLRAHTPWRDHAYDIAVDARVDTTFQHRSQHYTTTAATIAALHASVSSLNSQLSTLNSAASASAVAVFFPSYAYAEAIAQEVARVAPDLRIAQQPRIRDLVAQTAWVNDSLAFADALFLVLGSSFAEGIDALGGRVTHAMVVGPALPEVNAVQRARLAEFSSLGREASFRRVYQMPGMTKVNQGLGRLVRAPGQRARVLLHCRRFLEPSYSSLLAADYQSGVTLLSDGDLTSWLARPFRTAGTDAGDGVRRLDAAFDGQA